MTAGKAVPQMREDLVLERVANGCAVLDPRTEAIHLLNTTAVFVLLGCDGKTAIADIADQLAETAGIPKEQALRDAEQCLAQLQQLELLDE